MNTATTVERHAITAAIGELRRDKPDHDVRPLSAS